MFINVTILNNTVSSIGYNTVQYELQGLQQVVLYSLILSHCHIVIWGNNIVRIVWYCMLYCNALNCRCNSLERHSTKSARDCRDAAGD